MIIPEHGVVFCLVAVQLVGNYMIMLEHDYAGSCLCRNMTMLEHRVALCVFVSVGLSYCVLMG